MKNNIKEILQRIEKESGVSILFAIENGSRSWGMASKNSDYDVRFVFYRRARDYFTMTPQKDVINAAYDGDMKPCGVQGSLIDISGFDIVKYLKLLAASNPTTIEWLYSPIVYYGSNDLPLRPYMRENFNRKSLVKHYFSLFINDYKRITASSAPPPTYKKYLYGMRGLLNAEYVCHFDAIPPLSLAKTVEEMRPFISPELYHKVGEVIELKSKGMEKDAISRIAEFDAFFVDLAQRKHDNFPPMIPDPKFFDGFLQSLLFGDACFA